VSGPTYDVLLSVKVPKWVREAMGRVNAITRLVHADLIRMALLYIMTKCDQIDLTILNRKFSRPDNSLVLVSARVPGHLLLRAEECAAKKGVSRNELIAGALMHVVAGIQPEPQKPLDTSVYVACSNCGHILYVYALSSQHASKYSGPPEVKKLVDRFGGTCPYCGAPLQPRPKQLTFIRFKDFEEKCKITEDNVLVCSG